MRAKYMKKSSQRETSQAKRAASQEIASNPSVSMDAMRSVLMRKAMADRSHRIDLPEAMRAKMEAAFGMDFGNVSLYESESVADAGANAIAQGGNIAFAPGKADFNSVSGQSLLGHELSHVASQARGQVAGSGYLDNSALEARADREGALAAQGQQVYDGPVMDAPSFSAAAPMQANKDKEQMKAQKKAEKMKAQGKKESGIARTDNDQARADARKLLVIKNKMRANQMSGRESDYEMTPDDVEWYNQRISHPTKDLHAALLDNRDEQVDEMFDALFGNVGIGKKEYDRKGDRKHHTWDVDKFVSSKANWMERIKHLFVGRKDQMKKLDRQSLRTNFYGGHAGKSALSLETVDTILDDMTGAYGQNRSAAFEMAQKRDSMNKVDTALQKDARMGMQGYNSLQRSSENPFELSGHMSEAPKGTRTDLFNKLLSEFHNERPGEKSAENETTDEMRDTAISNFIEESRDTYGRLGMPQWYAKRGGGTSPQDNPLDLGETTPIESIGNYAELNSAKAEERKHQEAERKRQEAERKRREEELQKLREESELDLGSDNLDMFELGEAPEESELKSKPQKKRTKAMKAGTVALFLKK